jgi:diaminopimelate decarboxylase
MHHFNYQNNQMYCEDVPVAKIAKEATLRHHFRTFQKAFEGTDHIVCFSAKANSNQAVLRLFASLGGGLDIVSGGELFRGLKAGIVPEKIVFSGVGKREDEIAYGLKSGILMFNVESFEELKLIDECASRLGKTAPISLRVNPDVDPKTHPYISTGLKKNKFGLNKDAVVEAYKGASGCLHVEVIGISCHIGSQITEVNPFVDALVRVKDLIGTLESIGITISYLDLGGGLGITYDQESPPHPSEYGRAILETLGDVPVTLILEPGRVIVGNAGILVTKVLYTKGGEGKEFVIVDSAMNDLARPSLYDAYHAIEPVLKGQKATIEADVVGPSSNYNSRPRVAEVMVKGDAFHVVRARESYEDLVKGESIPAFL